MHKIIQSAFVLAIASLVSSATPKVVEATPGLSCSECAVAPIGHGSYYRRRYYDYHYGRPRYYPPAYRVIPVPRYVPVYPSYRTFRDPYYYPPVRRHRRYFY
ncbi:MAG: hypothetical protein SFT94_06325 [Pseudanabaenaceae cyanobacterium bins.68]|nr:hypothetical protein [Pseudanabaenaceae cyanobacterium bins.68]